MASWIEVREASVPMVKAVASRGHRLLLLFPPPLLPVLRLWPRAAPSADQLGPDPPLPLWQTSRAVADTETSHYRRGLSWSGGAAAPPPHPGSGFSVSAQRVSTWIVRCDPTSLLQTQRGPGGSSPLYAFFPFPISRLSFARFLHTLSLVRTDCIPRRFFIWVDIL